jgi:chromosome segregation ATPase
MSHDDLDHIPSIVPSRDNPPQRPAGSARAKDGGSSRAGQKPGRNSSAGNGLLTRLFIAVSLVVAAVACAWAWQLQEELQQANVVMVDYAERIGDLEARLSDTDQGMSQNAAVQAAKIRELDVEVRKLWDNVWKQSKARLAKLEASSTSQGKTLGTMEKSLSSAQSQLKSSSGDIAKLKSVAGDLDRLMSSAKANQAEVERVADTLNRINLDISKINKRVQGNEEWLASVNAFRKQVNAQLSELRASISRMQGAPGA